MQKKYQSNATWPKGTFDSQNNQTKDTHDTKEHAQSVCSMLHKYGAGGNGKSFPLKTWVTDIKD